MSDRASDPRFQILADVLEAEGLWVKFPGEDGFSSLRARTPEEVAALVLDTLDKFAGDEAFCNPDSGDYYPSLRAAHEQALRRKIAAKVKQQNPDRDFSDEERWGYRTGRDDAVAVILDGDL
jgi:hypothetical protein